MILVAKATEQALIRCYPHLTEKAVQLLFTVGKVRAEDPELSDMEPTTVWYTLRRHTLRVPAIVAEVYEVDEVMDLAVGSEGIIYTVVT